MVNLTATILHVPVEPNSNYFDFAFVEFRFCHYIYGTFGSVAKYVLCLISQQCRAMLVRFISLGVKILSSMYYLSISKLFIRLSVNNISFQVITLARNVVGSQKKLLQSFSNDQYSYISLPQFVVLLLLLFFFLPQIDKRKRFYRSISFISTSRSFISTSRSQTPDRTVTASRVTVNTPETARLSCLMLYFPYGDGPVSLYF